MDRIDCVVIGAGVIGLSVARSLALAGREVIVVEQHAAIGMETSSRNSEVIHAGLYYPTGSLKAELCVSGRDALYAYCEERGLAHKRCGKLIVATSEAQLPALESILRQAHANRCHEVRTVSANEASMLEPELSCVAALLSPNTGIIDTHAYMLSLQADAEHAGAETEFEAATVVNCGGLWAPRVAGMIAGLDQAFTPTPYFAKGNYYSLAGKAPFSHLIYPVPEAGGLGVHLTLDLGSQARFGPDVEWLSTPDKDIDYAVDPHRADKFYQAIRSYWPALEDGSLQPAYSGVRPKISAPGQPAADFSFSSHGSSHYLGLYGIESPGLTASLAIGEHVARLATAGPQ